jgi:cysteine-rich repeat protein
MRADLAFLGDLSGVQPGCGNGFIEASRGEVCDDGNKTSGDGCRGDCASVECPASESFEDPVTHHCSWRDRDVIQRSSAAARCAQAKAVLVRWASAAERQALYPKTLGQPGGKVWIGLTRMGNTWVWDGGGVAPAAALNFASGEPSGDGDCVEWREDGNDLNDIPCTRERDFICKRVPAGIPAP